MKKLMFLTVVFALFIVENVNANVNASGVKKISPNQISIQGRIGLQTAIDFAALVDDGVTEIIVTSEGGNTEAALDIAEIIQTRGLNVTVKDYCISSCANYIFVAAVRKKVLNRSLVGWHGGHHNALFAPNDVETTLRKILELIKREQRLYLNAKTSLELIIYSGILTTGEATEKPKPTLGPDGKYYLVSNAIFEFEAWSPRVETLQKLGMSGIDEYWHPGSQEAAENLVSDLGFGRMKIFTGDIHSYVPQRMVRKQVVKIKN